MPYGTGEPYDSSGDVWSVGIMMVQLWLKRYPFEDNISSPIELLTGECVYGYHYYYYRYHIGWKYFS
jgi:serine/threonine protein kinase